MAEKKEAVIDCVIDEILDENTAKNEGGVLVNFPEQRPVPTDVFVKTIALFAESMGRQPNEISLSFDGYTILIQPEAYPHIPAIKCYHISIERDGQEFYRMTHKVFDY